MHASSAECVRVAGFFIDTLEPIMLWKMPIMLLISAQKSAYYAQNYAPKISIMLEQVSDCSIRVSWFYFHEVWIISQKH